MRTVYYAHITDNRLSCSKNSREEENGGDDLSVKSNSEHSGGVRSEQDFYERHAAAYFSSDDDLPGDSDSDEDGLTAKVGCEQDHLGRKQPI